MKHCLLNPLRPTSLAARLAIVTALAAAVGWGCGWSPPENSARFSGYTERFLSRLPKYPTYGSSGLEMPHGEYGWEETEKREKEIAALWDSVGSFEQTAQWDKLRQTLNQYLQKTAPSLTDQYVDVTDCQARRNSAQDRLDALTALAQGASNGQMQSYLMARDAFEDDKYQEAARFLDELNPPQSLSDNAAYLRAAITYKQKDYAAAAALFEENQKRFPRSEKREANRFMFAQAARRASLPENSAGADTAERGAWLQKAAREFEEIGQAKGRYADDARGLLPSLWSQTGQQAKALAEYYRLLASPNPNTRIDAAQSIGLARGEATDETLTQVENDLADEPAAAYAYAYHTLYNYLPQVGDYYDDPERSVSLRQPERK
jgi:TolA-binding protein